MVVISLLAMKNFTILRRLKNIRFVDAISKAPKNSHMGKTPINLVLMGQDLPINAVFLRLQNLYTGFWQRNGFAKYAYKMQSAIVSAMGLYINGMKAMR